MFHNGAVLERNIQPAYGGTVDKELRILMLEDNPADAELEKYELERGGLEFVARRVETEDSFRKELVDFRPDLILSDYELPTFDGISALIIAQSTSPDVPFIFVTGKMGEETAIDMLHRGATDYVLKDRLSRLLPAVTRALDEVEEQIRRREAEEGLRKSEAELRKRAERLTHFITVASHELRHPITIIKGYAEILATAQDKITGEVIKGVYVDIDKAADRLTRIVEELMDVSLIEDKKFHIEPKQIDPRPLCEDAREEMKKRGFQNQIEIEISDRTPTLNVDPGRFYDLLVILLDNACTYSEASSPVLIRFQSEPGGVAMAVMDKGPGIPEADRERIFERFYQVVDALHHSKPGMGLGLYVAEQIVEAHGGRIWCEPREGGGSVFLVTFG